MDKEHDGNMVSIFLNHGNHNQFGSADDYGNIIIWNIDYQNKKQKKFGKMIKKLD